MARTRFNRGVFWPWSGLECTSNALTTVETADLLNERIAFSGRLFMANRASGAKTFSAANGGSISFRTGPTGFVFDNGSSNITIGLQDVSLSAGPFIQPDNAFDVSRSVAGGGGHFTANAWNTFSMTGGSGSRDYSHGELVSVVFDMTARAGSDVFNVLVGPGGTPKGQTGSNFYNAAAWRTGAGSPNNVLITFDDGTLATLESHSLTCPVTAQTQRNLGTDNNPDERGIIFTVDEPMTVDAFAGFIGIASATANYNFLLVSDPLGAGSGPTTLASAGEIDANAYNAAFQDGFIAPIPFTEVDLWPGVVYGAFVRGAISGQQSRITTLTLADAAHRVFLNGGTNLRGGYREGGSGVYTASDTEIPLLTLRVNALGARSVQLVDSNVLVA